MFQYLLKRVLIFIPTLVVISLLAFVISINSPADPVEQLARSASSEGDQKESSATEAIKNEIREKLGLNLPVFYLTLATLADPDTLHFIPSKNQREAAQMLVRNFGNWENIEFYLQTVKEGIEENRNISIDPNLPESVRELKSELVFNTLSLLEISDPEVIKSKVEQNQSIAKQLKKNDISVQNPSAISLAWNQIQEQKSAWKNYVPVLKWNGLDNQYHIWLLGDLGTSFNKNRKGFIRGDFGYSFIDNQPVAKKIGGSFFYSFVLVMLSIFFAYLISIPLGVYAAYKNNSTFDNVSSIITFMLYSLPSFFVGIWLLFYFANPDHFYWFPSTGVQDPSVFDENWSWWKKLVHRAPYFVLPTITYTYSSFAFISRIMKVSMMEVLSQEYIKTARAKGLSEFQVITRHALKNALLPIITMFANIFPAAIGGSVILETIFGIPGMGKEIYNAVLATDIPMIVAVFTITGVLTIIGYLFADILYALIDPRIKYHE